MIVFIKGLLSEKEPMRVVVETAGIGYELAIPVSTYEKLPRIGAEVKLLTFHSIREDDEALYGFATADERELFLKLMSVSGVGPKMAIAILSGASVGELSMAIVSGDAKRLAAVKGVGKKTAEKICVELKDKVNALAALGLSGGGVASTPGVRDAVAALRALGFNEETSAKMVSDIIASHPEMTETDRIIKLALSGGKK